MPPNDGILIWGCGGFGREVAWLCEQIGVAVCGFIDEDPQWSGKTRLGLPVFSDLKAVAAAHPTTAVLCAGVGAPATKQDLVRRTINSGLTICAPLIHPRSEISTWCEVGEGTVITAGCVATVEIVIGAHVIVNLNSTIGHDSRIGDYVTINPGCNISGNVEIGEGAYIGTNAAIREKVKVGRWSVIAGGAFVTQDVPPYSLYAGVPAVLKKTWVPL